MVLKHLKIRTKISLSSCYFGNSWYLTNALEVFLLVTTQTPSYKSAELEVQNLLRTKTSLKPNLLWPITWTYEILVSTSGAVYVEIREKAALLKFCNNYGPTIPLEQPPRDLNGTVLVNPPVMLTPTIRRMNRFIFPLTDKCHPFFDSSRSSQL